MCVPWAAGGTCLHWFGSEGTDSEDVAVAWGTCVEFPGLSLLGLLQHPAHAAALGKGSAAAELGGEEKQFPKEKGWNVTQVTEVCCFSGNGA